MGAPDSSWSSRWGAATVADRARRAQRAAAVALTCALAPVALAGCSVAVQEHPVVVGTGRLRAPTAAAAPGDDAANRIEVYLVKHDRLAGVYRPAPAGRGLRGALRALTAPLDGSEQAAGYRSALPSGGGRLAARARAGIAYVELPSGFGGLGVSEQVLAIGQITDTLTRLGSVDAVQLTHQGHDVDIPVAGGRLVPGPVTAANYKSVTAPEPKPTPRRPTGRPRSTTQPGSASTDKSPSGSAS